MKFHWIYSIRLKIIALMVVPVILLFILLIWNTQKMIHDFVLDNIHSSLSNYSQTLNLALSIHLASLDSLDNITPFLQELISIKTGGITYLVLLDEQSKVIASTDQSPSPLPVADKVIDSVDNRATLHIEQPILLGEASVGSLRYGVSIAYIKEAARQMFMRNLKQGVSVLGIILGVLISLTVMILLGLSRRLTRLMDTSTAIANGEYGARLKDRGRDEIRVLSRQMNRMAAAIQSRISELKENEEHIQALNSDLNARHKDIVAINDELVEAMEQLKRSQSKLIHTEKLASLGSIVAAVAHELNTPIGNALTVATTFKEKSKALRQEAQEGLRKSTLDGFMESSDSACQILLRNLVSAADMISSFKHVAVDQTSSQPRNFMLDDVIHDVLATLLPTIKHQPLRVETDLAEGIKMDSFPGPLGQVLNNLFNNAVMHAFDEDQEGVIAISAEAADDNHAVIRFRDNGKGISAQHLSKLFDPFFTTKLGKGGSGLGLNIVYNIVTGTLQGEISVDSEPGKGTTFEVRLPLHAAHSASTQTDTGPQE